MALGSLKRSVKGPDQCVEPYTQDQAGSQIERSCQWAMGGSNGQSSWQFACLIAVRRANSSTASHGRSPQGIEVMIEKVFIVIH